jgi:hypothetical protein
MEFTLPPRFETRRDSGKENTEGKRWERPPARRRQRSGFWAAQAVQNRGRSRLLPDPVLSANRLVAAVARAGQSDGLLEAVGEHDLKAIDRLLSGGPESVQTRLEDVRRHYVAEGQWKLLGG